MAERVDQARQRDGWIRRRAGRFALAAILLVAGALASADARAGSRDRALQACRVGAEAYGRGDFAASLTAYRDAIAEGYVSADLFYATGCAAYRAGEPGWAVYYFEQARRRAPGDPDVAANLALAEREAQGDGNRPGDANLLDRVAGALDAIDVGTAWAVLGVLLWVTAAAQILRWLRGRGRLPARTVPILAVLLAASAVLVWVKLAQRSLAPEAMLIRPENVRVEPSPNATVEFSLPAGSAFDLGRRQAGWLEIVVSASLRGWVPAENVAFFDQPR